MKLVEPGESAFDDPAFLAQSRAVRDAAASDLGGDATLAQQAAVIVLVVAAVGIQDAGLAPRPADHSADRGWGVDQARQLGHVMPVPAGPGCSSRGTRETVLTAGVRTVFVMSGAGRPSGCGGVPHRGPLPAGRPSAPKARLEPVLTGSESAETDEGEWLDRPRYITASPRPGRTQSAGRPYSPVTCQD